MKPKPHRPIPTFHFTQKGFQKLQKEYEKLRDSRPDAIEHLKKAREMGDLSENGYYKASKFKLISIDNRLRQLQNLIKYTKIISPTHNETVNLGSTVNISDGKTNQEYMIVGPFEANPQENKISDHSPIGKALIGKKKGEIIEIQTLLQKTTYTILKIK